MIGRDWPSTAQTMIGLARMRNLRVLAERVVKEGIPGDMLEAGVWRGGACILMRGILTVYGVTDRTIWVAELVCWSAGGRSRDLSCRCRRSARHF